VLIPPALAPLSMPSSPLQVIPAQEKYHCPAHFKDMVIGTVTGKTVKVGTCGFNRSRKLIFSELDVVELQQTFYDPPPTEKLAAEAPQGFEFTVKAWMLVTHKYTKTLWRRIKRRLPGRRENYGFFQPTEEVEWAWSETVRAARAVGARIIVLQSPASFRPSDQNISNVESFFKRHVNEGFLLAWEPRGEWWEHPHILVRLSSTYGVVIVGDYLRGRVPEYFPEGVGYTRLHGLGGGEVNYRYKYTDEDLLKLKNIIFKINNNIQYVLFNNVYSYADAVRFKNLLQGRTK